MKTTDVPQYAVKAYMGLGKALYALDDAGNYTLVRSAGWEAEEIVLSQAVVECERLTEIARVRVANGESSPLEYHMYRNRMDVVVLAQSTRLFRWQVRRHLRPKPFAGLPTRTRKRYADALGLSLEELCTVPVDP